MTTAVSTRKKKLSQAEIQQAFADDTGTSIPKILTTDQVAKLLQISRKTVYEWIAKGHLDGSFRKRGKGHLFWRDRVTEIIFNGKEWQ
jgi:excisionase family DNA binding protein